MLDEPGVYCSHDNPQQKHTPTFAFDAKVTLKSLIWALVLLALIMYVWKPSTNKTPAALFVLCRTVYCIRMYTAFGGVRMRRRWERTRRYRCFFEMIYTEVEHFVFIISLQVISLSSIYHSGFINWSL